MTTISIEIKNLPQIKAAFLKSPAKMVSELNIAIKNTVLKIQAESMRNTPVLTGRLRASHTSLLQNLKGIIEPKANYAFWVHDGTKYMAARPFLLNAVNTEQPSTDKYFEVAVQNTLDSIAKDIG